jgi:cellulose synthase/poly-beta-1,6-N-acetylglucosamine synthase-like glycosyltransferase
MTVSIIIAVKGWQKNLENCVNKCQELDFPDFEIIVLPDESIHAAADSDCPRMGTVPVSIFPTGALRPADKRDIAIKYAKGEIIAFLDDDAYPEKNWLKNAVENFRDPDVAAVGGPAVTPYSDSYRQQASGAIFSSPLVSSSFIYRYIPRKRREVNDYPSCNLLVRKSVMQELGGFNTEFWPGEDTKLCLDITRKLNKKIIYDPTVYVFHHRRPVFIPHLKQVASYALHRGYFVKKYPETSFKLPFFLPSLFVIAVLGGAGLSLISGSFRVVYLGTICLYLLLTFICSISKQLRLIPAVFLGIILSHFAYGVYFLKGLISKKLREEA